MQRRLHIERAVVAVVIRARKRPGNRAFRKSRRQRIGVEDQRLHAVIELRDLSSISSAEKLSDTSHPVSSVSAPRLAPPAIKRRRARSGIILAASLTNNLV